MSDVYAQLRARPWAWAVLGLSLAGLAAGMALFLPRGVDWSSAFRPASLAVLSGRSPYSVNSFFNPPWTVIPFIPIAVLPEAIRGFLTSPPVLHCVLNGNVEWLALLGVVLPPNIDLVLLAITPQMGIAVIVYQLVESGRIGGLRRIDADFWPLAGLTLITFGSFGLWPLRSGQELTLWWNASLWPESIPIGLAFLTAALTRRRVRPALIASPSPVTLRPAALLGRRVGRHPGVPCSGSGHGPGIVAAGRGSGFGIVSGSLRNELPGHLTGPRSGLGPR